MAVFTKRVLRYAEAPAFVAVVLSVRDPENPEYPELAYIRAEAGPESIPWASGVIYA